jgi:hypothetical protein
MGQKLHFLCSPRQTQAQKSFLLMNNIASHHFPGQYFPGFHRNTTGKDAFANIWLSTCLFQEKADDNINK